MQDVPKIVLKRLLETADAGTHPDADLLTAFAEQALAQSERARLIEHLARCRDCREVVGFALPAAESVAVTASATSTRSSWLGWPFLRWSVVVAGILAITSVGIVQYRQHRKSDTLVSSLTPRHETTAAEPTPSPSPAASELQEVLPQTEKERQAEMRERATSTHQDTLAAGQSARSLKPILPAPHPAHAAGFGGGHAIKPGQTSSSLGTFAPAAKLKSATPEETAKLAPNQSAGQQVEVPSSSQAVELVQSDAAAGTATAQDASSIERVSPRWSIGADGALQRSFDAGHTWVAVNVNSVSSPPSAGSTAETTDKRNRKVEAQPSPSSIFRAVSAAGTEVWAGGSPAMLYHSSDSGAHWARVLPSSSGATLTGDITSIAFSDPQHGRIATSAGEIWITADAGQTWRRP